MPQGVLDDGGTRTSPGGCSLCQGRQDGLQHRLEECWRQAPQPLVESLLTHLAGGRPEHVLPAQQCGQHTDRRHLPPDQGHHQGEHHRQGEHPLPQSQAMIVVPQGVGRRGQQLLQAGIHHLAENRVQEALSKYDLETGFIAAYPQVSLHLIGQLQTNKAKKAVELAGSSN